MSAFLADLPALLLLYGYPVLFTAVLAGAIGIPLPASVLLFAAGGYAADGDLDLALVLTVAVVAAVAGDCTSYSLARWMGEAAVGRHGHRIGLTVGRLDAARKTVDRWSGLAVFLSRWLLTPAAVPVNVVAALDRYPVRSFAAAAFVGEILWSTLYVGGGYVIGEAWDDMMAFVGDSLGLIGGLTLAVVGVVVAVKLARRSG